MWARALGRRPCRKSGAQRETPAGPVLRAPPSARGQTPARVAGPRGTAADPPAGGAAAPRRDKGPPRRGAWRPPLAPGRARGGGGAGRGGRRGPYLPRPASPERRERADRLPAPPPSSGGGGAERGSHFMYCPGNASPRPRAAGLAAPRAPGPPTRQACPAPVSSPLPPAGRTNQKVLTPAPRAREAALSFE